MNRRFSKLLAFFVAFTVMFTCMPFMTGDAESFAASSGKPGKVKSLSAALQGSNSAMLNWSSAGKKVSGYAVYRDGKLIKRLGKKTRSYTDTGLTKGTTYKYYVKAYNTYKVRKWYNKNTGKWQTKKPAAKYRGKSKKVKAYKYGARSPERTVTLAADAKADEPAGPASGTVGDFTYATGADGNLILTEYSGKEEAPVIPDNVNGKKVTAIGNSCFRGNAFILDLTLPEGIQTIEDFAFEACSLMKTVKFPSTLRTIGNGAFNGCAEIEELDIPDGVESIGEGAFLYCMSVRRAVLPKNLTSMGKFAFAGCENMKKVTFRGNKLEALPDRAFCNDKKLSNVVLPEGIKTIGKRAFFSCEDLNAVNLPRTLESVGDYAFENCMLEGTMVFPGSGDLEMGSKVFCVSDQYLNPDPFKIEFWGKVMMSEDTFAESTISGITLHEGSEGCIVLDNVIYSASGKVLTVFSNRDSRELTLNYRPDGTNELTSIGENAFKGVDIDTLLIPSSVTNIDETAFHGAHIGKVLMIEESGKVVEGNGVITVLGDSISEKDESGKETLLRYFRPAESKGNKDYTYIIPDNVNTIGPYAFFCADVMNVTLTDNSGLTLVREYAFTNSNIAGEEEEDWGQGKFIIPESLKDKVTVHEDAFDGYYYFDSDSMVGSKAKQQSEQSGKDRQSGNDNKKKTSNKRFDGNYTITYQSLAGDKNLFDEEKYSGYKIIHDNFREWCTEYMEFNKDKNMSVRSMPYTMLYKGEAHYREMTCALNFEKKKMEHAIKHSGDDFREMYLMMDHGLFAEIERAEAPDDLILYSGIAPDKVAMFAGWPMEEWSTFDKLGIDIVDELINAIGTEVTDPAVTSTTTDANTSAGFSRLSETIIIIYASKEALDDLGQVCIEALYLAEGDDEFYSGEEEVLFNASAKYKVLDVGTMEINGEYRQESRTYIKVELLGQNRA